MKIHFAKVFGAYVSEEFQYSQRISIKGGNKTCIRFSKAIILLGPFQIFSYGLKRQDVLEDHNSRFFCANLYICTVNCVQWTLNTAQTWKKLQAFSTSAVLVSSFWWCYPIFYISCYLPIKFAQYVRRCICLLGHTDFCFLASSGVAVMLAVKA